MLISCPNWGQGGKCPKECIFFSGERPLHYWNKYTLHTCNIYIYESNTSNQGSYIVVKKLFLSLRLVASFTPSVLTNWSDRCPLVITNLSNILFPFWLIQKKQCRPSVNLYIPVNNKLYGAWSVAVEGPRWTQNDASRISGVSLWKFCLNFAFGEKL